MSSITIDIDGDSDSNALQIRELPTDELLKLGELINGGFDLSELVSDELRHRKEHGDKLQSANQPEQIESVLSDIN